MKTVDEKRAASAVQQERGKGPPGIVEAGVNEQRARRRDGEQVTKGLHKAFEVALSVQTCKHIFGQSRAIPTNRGADFAIGFAQDALF